MFEQAVRAMLSLREVSRVELNSNFRPKFVCSRDVNKRRGDHVIAVIAADEAMVAHDCKGLML